MLYETMIVESEILTNTFWRPVVGGVICLLRAELNLSVNELSLEMDVEEGNRLIRYTQQRDFDIRKSVKAMIKKNSGDKVDRWEKSKDSKNMRRHLSSFNVQHLSTKDRFDIIYLNSCQNTLKIHTYSHTHTHIKNIHPQIHTYISLGRVINKFRFSKV